MYEPYTTLVASSTTRSAGVLAEASQRLAGIPAEDPGGRLWIPARMRGQRAYGRVPCDSCTPTVQDRAPGSPGPISRAPSAQERHATRRFARPARIRGAVEGAMAEDGRGAGGGASAGRGSPARAHRLRARTLGLPSGAVRFLPSPWAGIDGPGRRRRRIAHPAGRNDRPCDRWPSQWAPHAG